MLSAMKYCFVSVICIRARDGGEIARLINGMITF